MANTVRNRPDTDRATTIEEPNPLESIQDKYEQNKKRINTALTAVLLVIAGFFGYQKLIKEPKEVKAASAIAFAQGYFAQDSLNKALNGDGQHQGFLQIIKKYESTPTGNLAQYYAGICYLQMNDPKNAIKHLKEFNAKGTNIEYVAFGALGDAYMETNQLKEGIEYYSKAASNKSDNLLTPMYLFRLGVAYEMNNQADKAKESYKRIRDEYPQSMQAREIDKSLARLGALD